ncbi:MAG: hypothetical protein PHR45_00510 [Muribaculaceae bacterium]|nr:hypothetical protein [Muribaculaceae bacterium]
MLKLRNILLIIACCIGVSQQAISQELAWSVDFNTIFDNREGDDKFTDTKTFFQTRLAPEIGISLKGNSHRIAAGAVWTQPIGSEWNGYKISPTLYYRYTSPVWKFSFGMFPRTQLIQTSQNFIISDSLSYNQANIRGAMVQYTRENGFFEAYIDWRGMQSETQREAFSILFHGEWNKKHKVLIAGGTAMMNHLAKQKNPPEGQSLVDNIIVNPYLGLNLAKVTPLDSFTIKAGALLSINRDRSYDKWDIPCGLWVDLTAEWKFLGLKNTLYTGGKLYPYYNKFGSILDMGEPYYQSSFYNRTSVYAYIMRNWFMNLEASLDFNIAKDNFTFYQRLLLRVFIDQNGWKDRKNSHKGERLRNLY